MSYLRNSRPSSIVRTNGGHAINPPISSASPLRDKRSGRIYERSLSEADVYLDNVAGDGTCQIRTSLDTSFDGDEVTAQGVAFSVQALDLSLDIQALEFANPSGADSSNINIYARKGGNFSTTASDWITLATAATSVVSPDGMGMIVPRAEMQQAVTIAAGEIWTIYISSSTPNIKLISTLLPTGYGYQVDDFLQLNVGEAIGVGAEFSSSRTPGRLFQGQLFYRVLKPCSEMSTITEYTFPFVAASGIDSTKVKDAVTDGFNKLLTDEADLQRLTEVHGLSIKNVGLKSKGPSEDCSAFNLTDGCELYDSDLVFGHFESLQGRDLILEFLLKLNFQNGLGDLGNAINLTYVGDEVLQQQYDVSMTGIPSGTVLNPIQRDYLQQVTLDFLNAFSESKPNRVTIQHATENRRYLRSRESSSGGSMSSGSRSLQAGNVVTAGALVYGIGKDHDAFFQELERSFLTNAKQYIDAVQRQQYFPGEINDEENFGAIFENITAVSAARSTVFEPTLPPTTSTSSKDKLDSAQIQIIVFSIVLGISFFWLFYRLMKDCFLVQDGWAVKKEKLSEKMEREKESTLDRPELSNMDKPRQRTSIAIDISSLPEVKLPKDDSSILSKPSSEQAKRRPTPTSRGIGATKSTDDLDMLRPRSNLSTAAPQEPTRGVRRAKSNDADLLFETSASTPGSNHGEPVRGVAKSKSSDFLNLMKWGAGQKSSEASVSSNPSVTRSKSNDLLNLWKDKGLASIGVSPTKDSKPASAKKKAKKAKKSTKPESGTTIGSTSHTKDGTKKKRNSSKKDLKVKGESSKKDLKVKGESSKKDLKVKGESSKKDLKVKGESSKKDLKVKGGEGSATPPVSPRVSKKQPKKEKSKENGVADGTVAKKTKKPKDTGETKEKKSPKKSSKSPKRSPAAITTS